VFRRRQGAAGGGRSSQETIGGVQESEDASASRLDCTNGCWMFPAHKKLPERLIKVAIIQADAWNFHTKALLSPN
jgi:hypothetical protein